MTNETSATEDRRATLQVLALLAEKISSGLPVCRSLREIQRELVGQPMADVVAAVLEDIEKGATVAEAMTKRPAVFSPSVVTLIRAGEATGLLDHMLILIVECAWRHPGRLL